MAPLVPTFGDETEVYTKPWLYAQRSGGVLPTDVRRFGPDQYDIQHYLAEDQLQDTPYDDAALRRARRRAVPETPDAADLADLVVALDTSLSRPARRPAVASDSARGYAGGRDLANARELLHHGAALSPRNLRILERGLAAAQQDEHTESAAKRLHALAVEDVAREVAGYARTKKPEAVFDSAVRATAQSRIFHAGDTLPSAQASRETVREAIHAKACMADNLTRLMTATKGLIKRRQTPRIEQRIRAAHAFFDAFPPESVEGCQYAKADAPEFRPVARISADAAGDTMARVRLFTEQAELFESAMASNSPVYRDTFARLMGAELLAAAPSVRERLNAEGPLRRVRRWLGKARTGATNDASANPTQTDIQLLDYWSSRLALAIHNAPQRLPTPDEARALTADRALAASTKPARSPVT